MDTTSLEQFQSLMSGYWFVWLVIALIPAVVMGIFTAKLARKKGYPGYFFTGFFFQLIGLIYVVGLPLSKDRAD